MLKLYTDGGVISKNPSPIGGTWAWCLVRDDGLVCQDSGVVLHTSVIQFPEGLVTNNQTELFAVVQGLSQLDCEAIVEICSDSAVTLGRVFKNFAFSNIPFWMKSALEIEKKRLVHFSKFTYTQLDGHPTKSHLLAGTGKRGNPVSKWNVLCDKLCNIAAQERIHQTISGSE